MKRKVKLKIVYIDLNESHFEDYSSSNCRNYGGGRIFAAYAKELLNNNKDEFWLYSNPQSFVNLNDSERKDRCVEIDAIQRQLLRDGHHITKIIPDAEKFDIICHHFSSYYINIEGLKCKQIAWSLGYSEIINENFENFILYNHYQFPRILNSLTKINYVPIGKSIPPFQEYKKQDYIFQCTRHCPSFGSIDVARFCAHHKIPVIFAGPLDKNYPLMNYVDGKMIKYLGVISEEEKIKLTKEARLYTFIHNWPTPMNLSSYESLSYGTPIAATNVGFWPSLVKEGINGFMINSFDDLLKAYENAPKLNQLDCYNSVKDFNIENMVNGFYKVFEEILK